MSTTWNAYHQRSAVLREIDRSLSWHSVDDVFETFEDLYDLLRAAQQLWFTALISALDVAIETGDGDLKEDVARAYRTVADHHAGLRRLLDQHAHHPAIEQSVRRERALIARAAGVSHSDEVIRGALRQSVRVPAPRKGLLARVFESA